VEEDVEKEIKREARVTKKLNVLTIKLNPELMAK
jgi:hypothetical protein